MKYLIMGANRISGDDQKIVVEADDRSHAEDKAFDCGLLVSEIHPIPEESGRNIEAQDLDVLAQRSRYASIVLACICVVLFFMPWLNLVIAEPSPVSFVTNFVSGIVDLIGSESTGSGQSSSSSGSMPSSGDMSMSDLYKSLSGLMLFLSPFVYFVGLVFLGLGGYKCFFNITQEGKSKLIGFLVGAVSFLMLFLGWSGVFDPGESQMAQKMMGAAGIGLTSWAYGVGLVTIAGVVSEYVFFRYREIDVLYVLIIASPPVALVLLLGLIGFAV